MILPVEFDPAARLEFLEAVDWYNAESSGLGIAFYNAVDLALKEVARNPDSFSPFICGTHRYLLSRFPYCIVYRENKGVIWIAAIAHTSRRPGYWTERLVDDAE